MAWAEAARYDGPCENERLELIKAKKLLPGERFADSTGRNGHCAYVVNVNSAEPGILNAPHVTLYFAEDLPRRPMTMTLTAIQFSAPTPTENDRKQFGLRALQKYGFPDPKLRFDGFSFMRKYPRQPDDHQKFGYTTASCDGAYNVNCSVSPLEMFSVGTPSNALIFTVALMNTSMVTTYDGPTITRVRSLILKNENAVSTSSTSF